MKNDDKVSLDDLYHAIAYSNGESGKKGRGRIVQSIGEDGERFAEEVFGKPEFLA